MGGHSNNGQRFKQWGLNHPVSSWKISVNIMSTKRKFIESSILFSSLSPPIQVGFHAHANNTLA